MKRDLRAIIAQMTLEEKAGMCSGFDYWHLKGVERLGIPSIMVKDGSHGLCKTNGSSDDESLFESASSTCFPSAGAMASSWDRELINEVGVAIGEECQAEGVAILLGPGANIKRSPLCGRNFDYFSEDPYLSSEMAATEIQGVQSQGVGTSLKHFAANNQENRRLTSDSIVDERTLREIYLASFEGAVKKGKPWTVMSAYNKVNGTYASENSFLLTDILKEEWNHDGFVIAEWGSVIQRVESLAAGLDLQMPSSTNDGDIKIVKAVRNGKLSMEILDNAVERLLRVIFKYVDHKKSMVSYNKNEHHQLARTVARESMVLLKNEYNLLPLSKGSKVAVIGEFAKKPKFQGGGTSLIVPTKLDVPLEEIMLLAGDSTSVRYAPGYSIVNDNIDQTLIEDAKEAARQADVAVIFAGLPDRYESEGYDRTHLQLPANQNKLIEAIAGVQSNIVVVLMNGSAIEMPWEIEVNAILEAHLGGQAVGGAIADLLYGEANPCGKLAETFPMALSDNPSYLFFPGEKDRAEYREGIFVGYRYYDTKKVKPLFPFGHGLSYTTFEYSDLSISDKEILDTDTVNVSVTVKNIGTRAGKEIVQLYIQDIESTVIRPTKELKGFAKMMLHPGEPKTVTFTLDKRSFAYYNVQMKDWHVESGDFNVLIGRSVDEIVLHQTLSVKSTASINITYHRDTLIGDLMNDTLKAPIAQDLIQKFKDSIGFTPTYEEKAGEMVAALMNNMPLRGLVSFSQGTITEEQLEELLQELNK
ncbi:glycoside hydrolase family 3 C-terminal domain-containing protein [Paenibacillus sp. LHD-117]|uniref:glycoside hydrolase family 3 C-terminal domain-containing protein n=1 Tax=Paenibacillus sp. LHD-117 TaxID=3071412 RepID=UPI0027DF16F8|nr:glycoside hydrolase family 3 C-terminal domain-containing protein [Paenibacillus sp. LHD-117]MDQ6421668.1 glycoside hydrolase family 3 C-terminal domain-containing protein [Paenibacillus sp. LHD-117]